MKSSDPENTELKKTQKQTIDLKQALYQDQIRFYFSMLL